MTRRRRSDPGEGWLYRPLYVALLAWAVLLYIAGIWVNSTTRYSMDDPGRGLRRKLSAEYVPGMDAADFLVGCVACWIFLFLMEFPLSAGTPSTERRNRRIVAGFVLLNLALLMREALQLRAAL